MIIIIIKEKEKIKKRVTEKEKYKNKKKKKKSSDPTSLFYIYSFVWVLSGATGSDEPGDFPALEWLAFIRFFLGFLLAALRLVSVLIFKPKQPFCLSCQTQLAILDSSFVT